MTSSLTLTLGVGEKKRGKEQNKESTKGSTVSYKIISVTIEDRELLLTLSLLIKELRGIK